LAHLAGRDPLRHALARVAVALCWFHPLAWIVAARLGGARGGVRRKPSSPPACDGPLTPGSCLTCRSAPRAPR
jgi:hypothetical protein